MHCDACERLVRRTIKKMDGKKILNSKPVHVTSLTPGSEKITKNHHITGSRFKKPPLYEKVSKTTTLALTRNR
jgi:copper chaperone CopZ